MMSSTTYGTIATAATTTSIATTSALRPWRELLNPSTFTIPDSYHHALTRIRSNLSYFKPNYTIILLSILFLTLLYRPISIILFVILSLLWYFLYFSQLGHKGKVVILGHFLEEKFVLFGLWIVTVLGLDFTGAGVNVLVGLFVGVVVVGLHAAFRDTEVLFPNDDDISASIVGSPTSSTSSTAIYSSTRI